MKSSIVLLLFISSFLALHVSAQQSPIILYPGGVPNSKIAPPDYKEKLVSGQLRLVTDPAVIPYFPAKEKLNGTSVLICPGGGYGFLAMESEGAEVAKKFNEIGVTALF